MHRYIFWNFIPWCLLTSPDVMCWNDIVISIYTTNSEYDIFRLLWWSRINMSSTVRTKKTFFPWRRFVSHQWFFPLNDFESFSRDNSTRTKRASIYFTTGLAVTENGRFRIIAAFIFYCLAMTFSFNHNVSILIYLLVLFFYF